MSHVRELLAIPIRSARRAGLAWGISLGALIAVTVAFYPAFRDQPALGEDLVNVLPPSVIEAFGLADFSSPAGFLRGNLYAVLVPLLMAVAGVLLMNGQTAADEDAGRMEAYLAQPVTRAAVFLGRAGGVVVWLVIIGLLMLVAQLATNALVGLDIATDRLIATIVLCVLLGALHAGAAAVIAGWTGRPGIVLAIGLVLAISGYIVAALFPLADVLAPWRAVSPWDWALGGNPLTDPTEPWRYVALALPAVLGIAAGAWLFGRRDVNAA